MTGAIRQHLHSLCEDPSRLLLHLLADDDLSLITNNDRVPRGRTCYNEIDLRPMTIYRDEITPGQ